jgi:RNA polymerase sigma-70 factor (ECF subfamily)
MDLESALTELAPNLLRFCTGLSGDPAEGEEIAQEALASLVRYWRRRGAPDSPKAFVCTVARRQAFRARWRRRLFAPLEAAEHRANPGADPEESSGGQDQMRAVLRALAELPGGDRQALLICALEELSVEEAARVLGISASAFKM